MRPSSSPVGAPTRRTKGTQSRLVAALLLVCASAAVILFFLVLLQSPAHPDTRSGQEELLDTAKTDPAILVETVKDTSKHVESDDLVKESSRVVVAKMEVPSKEKLPFRPAGRRSTRIVHSDLEKTFRTPLRLLRAMNEDTENVLSYETAITNLDTLNDVASASKQSSSTELGVLRRARTILSARHADQELTPATTTEEQVDLATGHHMRTVGRYTYDCSEGDCAPSVFPVCRWNGGPYRYPIDIPGLEYDDDDPAIHAQDDYLCIFRAFNELGLVYWVIEGGSLGAIRHGGKIPWDGDLDIVLPISLNFAACEDATAWPGPILRGRGGDHETLCAYTKEQWMEYVDMTFRRRAAEMNVKMSMHATSYGGFKMKFECGYVDLIVSLYDRGLSTGLEVGDGGLCRAEWSGVEGLFLNDAHRWAKHLYGKDYLTPGDSFFAEKWLRRYKQALKRARPDGDVASGTTHRRRDDSGPDSQPSPRRSRQVWRDESFFK